MPDIFTIENWSNSTVYKKNAAVKSGGTFYYSLVNNNSGNTPALGSAQWGGIGLDPIDYSTKAEFFWLPSYQVSIDPSPRVIQIKFGGGFSQNIPDGINSNLMTLDLNFAGRDADEALAIIHFLTARNGTETFLFTAPPPFSKKKRFICQSFPTTIDFYNNYSIKCQFQEVVV